MSADIVRYAGGGNALARTGDDEVVGAQRQVVTVVIERQTFGIPVLVVQDILGPQKITRVPLAPAEVAGALNLRGRIVTAINVRRRLGLAPRPAEMKGMNVVVEHDGELYSLMVDGVGEVLSLDDARFERNPANLAQHWRDVSLGVYRLNDKLLLVLDVERLFEFG